VVAPQGQFVWYELMTTDVEAAKAFYAKVMGWDTTDASMPGMAYTLFRIGEDRVGGVMNLPDDARRMGAEPRWIGYVGVDDVDAAADRITRIGGSLQVPPTDIPNVSRFAIFADPQAAMLGALKWSGPYHRQAADISARGRVGWHELVAKDQEKAFAFYADIFGWQKGEADVGAPGTYQLFSAGDITIGGMVTMPSTMQFPFWRFYFNTDDVDAAAKRVTAGGGLIVEGPLELPAGTMIVQCSDPQGAAFALEGRRRPRPPGYFAHTVTREGPDTSGKR